ncbi:hypothetical protein [Bacillus sp. FJAT-22090]|uniref:hypothetical protein n=1 Tax=Bacillus sp. FJAT-22090 TaxID=1581038 RepID=UPI0011A32677|nr:hypothetical protein [Bacillus sp. FJAT-22090]
MVSRILKKLFSAILSTLILCLVLSFIGYTPKGEQESASSYMTFIDLFVLYFIFALPIFLTVGILFSMFVDLKMKSKLGTILSYVIGGGIIGFLYYIFMVSMQAYSHILSEGIILFTAVGAFSALLFFSVQVFLNLFLKKLNLS